MVCRTYPIRVAGNSGSFGSHAVELDWESIQKGSGCPTPLKEITTVTKRIRRIATQSVEMMEYAINLNDPSKLAITFMDYINHKDFGITRYKSLSDKSRQWLYDFYARFGVPIKFVTTSPYSLIDRRK